MNGEEIEVREPVFNFKCTVSVKNERKESKERKGSMELLMACFEKGEAKICEGQQEEIIPEEGKEPHEALTQTNLLAALFDPIATTNARKQREFLEVTHVEDIARLIQELDAIPPVDVQLFPLLYAPPNAETGSTLDSLFSLQLDKSEISLSFLKFLSELGTLSTPEKVNQAYFFQ